MTWILTASNLNDLRLHSNANKKVIDTQCTFVLFSRVFAATQPRTVLTSLATAYTPSRGFNSRRKVFRINTYKSLSKQATLTVIESHSYKKHGGWGFFSVPLFARSVHPTRVFILSDHREPKDSSPVPLLAHSFRSLHKERFTTLLESKASTLFLEIAGCHPLSTFILTVLLELLHLPARLGQPLSCSRAGGAGGGSYFLGGLSLSGGVVLSGSSTCQMSLSLCRPNKPT